MNRAGHTPCIRNTAPISWRSIRPAWCSTSTTAPGSGTATSPDCSGTRTGASPPIRRRRERTGPFPWIPRPRSTPPAAWETSACPLSSSSCPAAAARRTCGMRGAKYGGASTPWRACPPFMEAGRSGRPSAWSCGTTPPRRRWSCSTACWRNTTSSRAPS